MPTHGKMTVDMSKGKAIVGHGNLSIEASRVWFDYDGKPYPSKLDWENASSLTFEPDMGRSRSWLASEVEYFFNSGWVAPRLVLER
jgi:hypothetical protein